MTNTILLAIPTNRYIEKETIQSIWNLQVPEGYAIRLEQFHGYQIDQIRNLIADWMVNGPFTHLFAVDSDIILPPDTLMRLMSHDADYVSGVYVQRIDSALYPEVQQFITTPEGAPIGMYRMDNEDLKGKDLLPVAATGFGCVLIKKQVFTAIEYPHFEYRSAVDHNNTVSEDTIFCMKAHQKGFKIFVDPTVRLGHKGVYIHHPDDPSVEKRLRYLSTQALLPTPHVEYLRGMPVPEVVYDIGACVLHWQSEAHKIWPSSSIFCFDAIEEAEFLYKENPTVAGYHIDVLGNSFRPIKWYQNDMHPGGNSVYRENPEYSNRANELFPPQDYKWRVMRTLDSIVRERKFPLPNMIKMDVQGAELDILQGAPYTLSQCTDLILELQHVEYNTGAPSVDVVRQWLETNTEFRLKNVIMTTNVDGDYHFSKNQ